MTRILPALLEGDYLRESESVPLGRGRPGRLLRVNPDKHTVVGVKIGPERVSGVVTDLAAQVLARAEQPLEDCAPGPVLSAAAALTGRLLAAVPRAAERALGLGVGVGGHIDPGAGVCRYAAPLAWRRVDVTGPLRRAAGGGQQRLDVLPALKDGDSWLTLAGNQRPASSYTPLADSGAQAAGERRRRSPSAPPQVRAGHNPRADFPCAVGVDTLPRGVMNARTARGSP